MYNQNKSRVIKIIKIKREIYKEKTKLQNLTISTPTSQKWSSTLEQKPMNCLSVFDHFVGLTVNYR